MGKTNYDLKKLMRYLCSSQLGNLFSIFFILFDLHHACDGLLCSYTCGGPSLKLGVLLSCSPRHFVKQPLSLELSSPILLDWWGVKARLLSWLPQHLGDSHPISLCIKSGPHSRTGSPLPTEPSLCLQGHVSLTFGFMRNDEKKDLGLPFRTRMRTASCFLNQRVPGHTFLLHLWVQ